MNDDTPTGGTHPDSTRLAAEEKKANQGLRQFARALRTIQREKLYRAKGYDSFADYLRREWDRERTWGYRHIWWAEVADMLPDGNRLTESQARAFRRLECGRDRDAIPEVWQRAVERYGCKPTRQQIDEEIWRWVEGDPVEAGEASEGELNATVEETKAHFGNRVGTPQNPTKDYTLMVPSEQAEEFNAHVNRLKTSWEIGSMVGVVTEAVRRAAEEEQGKAAHTGSRQRGKGLSLTRGLRSRR